MGDALMVGTKKECANINRKKHDLSTESHHVTIEDASDDEDQQILGLESVKTVITPTEFISDLSNTPSLASDLSSTLNELSDSSILPGHFTDTPLTPKGFESARPRSIDTSPIPLCMQVASGQAAKSAGTKTGAGSAKTPRLATRNVGTSTTEFPGTAAGSSLEPSPSGYGGTGSTRPSASTGADYGTRPSASTGTGYSTRPSASTGTGYSTRPAGTGGPGYGTRPYYGSSGPTRTRGTTTMVPPTDADGSPCYFYEPKFDKIMTAKERSYLKYKYGISTEKPRREFGSSARPNTPKVAINKTCQIRLACSRHMSFTNRKIHLQPLLPKSIGKYVPKDTFDKLHIVKPRPAPKDEAYSVPFRNNRTTKLRYMYNHLPTNLRRRVGEFENLPIETLDQPYSSKDPTTGEMNYVIEGIRYESLTGPPLSPAKKDEKKSPPAAKSVIQVQPETVKPLLETSKKSPPPPPPPVPPKASSDSFSESVSRKSQVITDKRARELKLREKREARIKRLKRLRLPFRV